MFPMAGIWRLTNDIFIKSFEGHPSERWDMGS